MRSKGAWVVLALGLFSSPLGLVAQERDGVFSAQELRRILKHSPLGKPPADSTNRVADDPAAARLGHFLFFETRFSSRGDISCATCHDPNTAFADAQPLATGIGEVKRHTMSLWNVAYNRWFFWDGRADSLWSQALEPLEHPLEMGGDRLRISHTISDDPELRRAYEKVFGPLPDLSRLPPSGRPDPDHPEDPRQRAWMSLSGESRLQVNRVFVNVAKAIAAYERRLVSRNSAFDRFVAGLRDGDATPNGALSNAAQRGLKLFVGRADCRLCHGGPNFTDGEFHNTRVPPLTADLRYDSGRFEGAARLLRNPFRASGEFSDDPNGRRAAGTRSLVQGSYNWGAFKTPSLRNVALSAPYMHQGQMKTLREVIHYYSTLEGASGIDHHQESILVPLNLTEQEITDLIAFLESLTDVGLDRKWLRPAKTPTGEP